TALPTQGFAYRLRNPQFRAQALPQLVERLGEAVRVRTFGLGERLEPVGDFLEAFVARGLRLARWNETPRTRRCSLRRRPWRRSTGNGGWPSIHRRRRL